MITGVVLARNEEANIVDCLRSLLPHVNELLLIDMESSDRTVELARPHVTRVLPPCLYPHFSSQKCEFPEKTHPLLGWLISTSNTKSRDTWSTSAQILRESSCCMRKNVGKDKVLPHPLVAGFDAARNMAIPEARFDWLWFLDADERVPPRTGELIRGLVRERGNEIVAITVPFKSYFCGKWIEHCGWWPGYTMPRVLKRGRFRFSERLHGGVEFSGPAIRLPPDPDLAIEHFSYRSIEHYVEKFNRYTTAEAGYLIEQGRPTCWHAAIAAMMHDLWLYYEKHDGRLDGERGWILSWLAGQYRWFSHAKVLDSRAERVETRAESPKRTGHGDGHVPASLDAVIQLMADELAALRSPSPQLPLGIVWRSPIWDPSGYADDSRLFLKALAHGPRDLAAREVRWSDATCVLPHADVALLKTLTRCQRPPFVAAITSCIPSCIPTLCPPDRSASLNILRATFETDRISADWLPIIEEFDEVWVFSTHDQRTFRRSGVPPEKLRVLPGFVDTEVFRGESPARTGESRALRPEGQEATGESPEPRGERQSEGPALPEALTGRFVFLSVFDWQLRKGWDVLLKAYCTEFSADEGIGLLLKITTVHGHAPETVRRQADEVLATLAQSLDQRPDIAFWQQTLGKQEMAALYRSVDAFVLASRGEGWGRPYMEAMSAGLPVIGTRGSGNDDFMHEGNSFLISTRRVDVPEAAAAEIPVYRGHRWLEPDLAELRAVLRRVAAEPEASQTVARQAASDVRAKYSVDRARDAVEEHLRAAEARFRTPDLARPADSQIGVELEGEFFAGHSFSNINEQLSLQWLADPRLALSLRRVAHNPTHDRAAFDAYRLRPYLGRELPGGPQVTIRHAFPPNWAPPERGRWVHIQPWEYGALPLDWVPPLRDRVDEIWAPSNYVKRVYEHSGIPAEKIHVIPWGVNPAVFCPDAPPLLIPTDRRFRFLFVGGTIHRKGFDLVLNAYLAEFSTADDVCLVVKDMGTSSFYRYGNCREQILAAMADESLPEIVYLERSMSPGQLASFRTPDMRLSLFERLMGLDRQLQAEAGPGEFGSQGVELGA